MAYRIKPHTKSQAKKIGVEVKPSKNKGKKIDVFKKGQKVASVGAIGYKDYPTYMALEKQGKVPKGTAKTKRKNYKKRHVYRKRIGTPAYYADKLLW
jgi:hypothetical protein|tara:strand:+ start:66 stop:356 length:291 start_codon:yes stop_codon:yes gene_type:complete